jgi:hypothetical protein
VLRRTIAQLDQKLDRYRDALEAGTNPALIATWTAEVESARAAAETELAGLGPASPRPIQNIPALIADIRQEWGTMAEALGVADGTRKGGAAVQPGCPRQLRPAHSKGSGDLPPKSK